MPLMATGTAVVRNSPTTDRPEAPLGGGTVAVAEGSGDDRRRGLEVSWRNDSQALCDLFAHVLTGVWSAASLFDEPRTG